MIVKSPAGTTVLTLGDTALVDGYLATLYKEGERTWVRIVAGSPFVDDDIEVIARRAGIRITVDVLIEGDDWDDATAKLNALIDAVEVDRWQLVVAGVTWVCNVADWSAPIPETGTAADYRTVSLSIPVRLQRGI